MKIHDTFYIFLLRSASIDSLIDQIQSSSFSIIVDEEQKYEVNDILNSRYHYNKLQYRVAWTKHFSNDTWYSAKNFDHAKEIIVDYYVRYSAKSKLKQRRNDVTTNIIIWINEISTLIQEKLVKTRQFLNQTMKMMIDILIKMYKKYQAKNTEKNLLSQKKISLIEWNVFINTFNRS